MNFVEAMTQNEHISQDEEKLEISKEGEVPPIPLDECSSEPSASQEEFDTVEEHAPVSLSTHLEKHSHSPYETFLKELQDIKDPESKIQHAISFMETALSQNTAPHFKTFWDVRQICLDLFKENISPGLRAHLWSRYSELSKEARRLKEILDEQSAFAAEQIEIAIKALEEDIHHFQDQLEKIPLPSFDIDSHYLKPKLSFYLEIQKKLSLLNAQATRINALRKELIKTEMRVKQKNKFFQRLSLAGDSVFPLRKELIKEISDQFIEDVNQFIAIHFGKQGVFESIFVLREEIKALQSIAKVLTLNTHSFTHTRLKLSECWDMLKGLDKERKKERAHQKVIFKQNVDDVMSKIKTFESDYQSDQLTSAEAHRRLDEISTYMRQIDLGKEEVKSLKDALWHAKSPLLEKAKQEEEERIRQGEERIKKRQQLLVELKAEIEALSAKSEALDADTLTQERDALATKIQEAALGKLERQELDRLIKPFKDLISEKKEEALISFSDDDRQAMEQLKEALMQKKTRRAEIKAQIESLRKSCAGSGLDFEQAMNFKSLLENEKERLQKCDSGIFEIEQKMKELKGSL